MKTVKQIQTIWHAGVKFYRQVYPSEDISASWFYACPRQDAPAPPELAPHEQRLLEARFNHKTSTNA